MKMFGEGIDVKNHVSYRRRLKKLFSRFLAVSAAAAMLSSQAGAIYGDELSSEYAAVDAAEGQDVEIHFGDKQGQNILIHVNEVSEDASAVTESSGAGTSFSDETETGTGAVFADETEAESRTGAVFSDETEAEIGIGAVFSDETEAETEAETESEETVTELRATLENDATVVVTCEPGVLPAGTTLRVTAVEGEDAQQAKDAVTGALDAEGRTLNNIYTYDVTLLDADGNEFEPSGEVSVHVEFHKDMIASEGDTDWNVFHIKNDGNIDDLSLNEEAELDITTNRGNDVKEADFRLDSFSQISFADTSGTMVTQKGEGTDFTSYITSVSVSKLENGNWVAATAFDDGDAVKTQIDFTIPADIVTKEHNTITYQLPNGLRPVEQQQGTAYVNGRPAGIYQIDTDGGITIVYNDSFATGEAFSGEIHFEGKVDFNGTGNNGTISFGGDGGTIEIRKSNATYDAQISKTSRLNKEDKTAEYEITVSTTKGTDPEHDIKITDDLSIKENSTAVAQYDFNSIQVFQVSTDGTKTQLSAGRDYTMTVDGDNYGFEVVVPKSAGPLAPGEKYVVSYQVNHIQTTDKSEDGYAKLGNYAGVYNGNVKNATATDIEIQKNEISKTGYSTNNGKIKWHITINNAGLNVKGKTFEDVLPEGLEVITDPVTFTSADGSKTFQADISTDKKTLSYTFPDNVDDYSTYSTAFYTTAPHVENGTKQVDNTATFNGKSSTGSAWVTGRDWNVSKKWVTEEKKDGLEKYKWSFSVVIENGMIPASGFTLTDVIHDATINGQAVPDSHYALISDLEDNFIHHLKLVTDEGEIRYRDIQSGKADGPSMTIHYYADEAGTQEVSPDDKTAHIKSYQIEVVPKDGIPFPANELAVSGYRTIVDKTLCEAGDTMQFTNSASVPDHTSTAHHEYAKPTDLKKSLQYQGYAFSQNTMNKFSNGNVTIDFDKFRYEDAKDKRILVYAIEVDRSGIGSEGLHLVDTIPEGTSYVPDSCRIYLANENGTADAIYNSGKTYWIGNANSPFEKDNSHDGNITFSAEGRVLTWDFGYYNTAGNVTISDTSETKGNLKILYAISLDDIFTDATVTVNNLSNSLEWEGKKTVSQTTTVTREYKNVVKTGSANDEEGTVSYRVVVNPSAKDLDPEKDVITLVDTMSLTANYAPLNGAAALEIESLSLHYYDPDAEGGLGPKVSEELYQLQFDDEKQTITATLQDETALVLVYTYNINTEATAADSISVTNRVELNGVFEASDTTPVKTSNSGSTVRRQIAKIYKLDKQTSKLISGAKFKVESYSSNSGWETVADNYELKGTQGAEGTKGTDGAEGAKGTDGTEGTGVAEGADDWNNDWGPNSKEKDRVLEVGRLYRLTETEAPKGYDKSEAEYYFAFVNAKHTADQIALPSGVAKDDVKFIDGNGANITVPNRPTEVKVKKVWLNADGTQIQDPPPIKVQLVKDYTGYNVTVRTKAPYSPGYDGIKTFMGASGSSPFTLSNNTYDPVTVIVTGEDGSEESHLLGARNYLSMTDLSLTITQDCVITIQTGYVYKIGTSEGDNIIVSYDQVEPSPSQVVDTQELNASNGYSYIWSALDKGYKYSIVEVDPPEDCTVSYSASGITNGTINVINRKKPGSLQITKTTAGNNTPATAQFQIQGPGYAKTIYYNDFIETDEAGKKVYTVTGLSPGDYTVTENVDSAQVDRYVLTVTGDQGTALAVRAGESTPVNIVNTYSGKTALSVTKVWKDGDGNDLSEEEIENEDLKADVVLYRVLSNAATATPQAVSEAEPERKNAKVTLSKKNNWSYTWDDLPKQDGNGVEYIYYVKEEEAEGFTVRYSSSESIGGIEYGTAKTSEISEASGPTGAPDSTGTTGTPDSTGNTGNPGTTASNGISGTSGVEGTVPSITISNYREVSYAMPATGGEGTHRIYLISLTLIALAGISLVMERKRNHIDND